MVFGAEHLTSKGQFISHVAVVSCNDGGRIEKQILDVIQTTKDALVESESKRIRCCNDRAALDHRRPVIGNSSITETKVKVVGEWGSLVSKVLFVKSFASRDTDRCVVKKTIITPLNSTKRGEEFASGRLSEAEERTKSEF